MSEIIIPGEELRQTAMQFKEAGSNTISTMKDLDHAILLLEKKWSGATQQVFYRKYKDLHQAMEGMSALMNNIAVEMTVMAERMNLIDSKDNFKG